MFKVTADELSIDEARKAVEDPAAGAIDLFLGVVRNENLGREVQYLEYDAYPEMAERVMRDIADEAKDRFGLLHCAILHRTGRLEIGETSLIVAVSSGHRRESFAGGHWLVDEIKKRVPVWKKEVWTDGEEWVEGPESLGLQQSGEARRA